MRFSKYHGAGNDFIICHEEIDITKAELSALAIDTCHRRTGVGADGLVVLSKPLNAPWRMQIFNADGSEAAMCGNAVRCVVRYLWDKKAIELGSVTINTLAGERLVLTEEHENQLRISVNMGKPAFQGKEIPLSAKWADKELINHAIKVDDYLLAVSAVSTGVPHCVVFLSEDVDVPWRRIGRTISNLDLFPQQTNVEFVTVVNRATVNVKVWERGVGPTLACGTGACAVVATGVRAGLLNEEVNVVMPGGTLHIRWSKDSDIWMTGPTAYVFTGEWLLPTK